MLTALLALGVPLIASGQEKFPSKPVKIVVALGAGGTLDILARLMAKSLGEQLKATFVVENRPGAGGAIGGAYVAKADPDGYTIGMFHSAVVTSASTLADLAYDPVKDFTPIGTMAANPLVFGVAADSPYKTIDDMVAAAKANAGKVTCGIIGAGTQSDINIELMRIASGVTITRVPYRAGSGAIITDVLGGRIDCYSGVAPSLIPQVRSGKMRILATTSPIRELPDVPTFASKGYPQVNLEVFFAAFGPPGLPKPVTDVLVPALKQALMLPENVAQIEKMGLELSYEDPQRLAEHVAKDLKTVRDLTGGAGNAGR